jgi:hypothetical protein
MNLCGSKAKKGERLGKDKLMGGGVIGKHGWYNGWGKREGVLGESGDKKTRERR